MRGVLLTIIPGLLILLVATVGDGFSQSGGAEGRPAEDTARRMIILNRFIFKGNKLTREPVIRRELPFREGDTLGTDELTPALQHARENLMNTSLFNFVVIDTLPEPGRPGLVNLRFSFTERWYIWPIPIFELADRNFNAWWKDRDFSRVNYGINLNVRNVRGRREDLYLYARLGHDEKYRLAYYFPFINRKKTLGLGAAAGLSRNHEVAYATINDELEYFKEERRYALEEKFAYLDLSWRRNIHDIHWIRLNFSEYRFSDSLLSRNDRFSFGNTGLNSHLSFYYQYKDDYRDFKAYPLTGHYFDAELFKIGLGLFDKGSCDMGYIKSTFRRFVKLHDRWYTAAGITGKYSFQARQPYFFQRGLGYGREFVRGYEYYVVDGHSFGLFKSNLKYELLRPRTTRINMIPTEKFNKIHYAFYLNAFLDAGYVENSFELPENSLSGRMLWGYGLGLDFVTYYDVVIRFEFSFNRMGENGFFIHFMPSI
jgi:outer membrane protein assembly factor BamA